MADIEYLSKIPFFGDLDEPLLTRLAGICTKRKFYASDILFYEKDENDDIFYLVDGAIKFYKVDRFDSEIFLYKIESHTLIFDISKLCQESVMTCYANAEFLQDSEVLVFEKRKFQELMHDNHEFTKSILRESFKMIRQLQCVVSRDIVFDGIAKVAHMLVNELDSFNKLKKHEIAYMLHIQPETLSRILKKLIRNGTIEVEKNCVKILNLEELREIYE